MIFDILTILEILASDKAKSMKSDFLKDVLGRQTVQGRTISWHNTYNLARDLELIQKELMKLIQRTILNWLQSSVILQIIILD